jgi:hypothetical protein
MSHAKLRNIIALLFLGTLTVGSQGQSTAAQPAAPQASIGSTIDEIVKAREYTAEYVSTANGYFTKNSKEYLHARALYADALSKYSGWDAYVASAIRKGNSKKLNSDPQYKKDASDAVKSASAFTDYVSEQTVQGKAVTAVISALADLGIQVWTKWRNQIGTERETAAKDFETATKWSSWDEIVSPPTVKPDPKPATPSVK